LCDSILFMLMLSTFCESGHAVSSGPPAYFQNAVIGQGCPKTRHNVLNYIEFVSFCAVTSRAADRARRNDGIHWFRRAGKRTVYG
jgi:hypothetical protein